MMKFLFNVGEKVVLDNGDLAIIAEPGTERNHTLVRIIKATRTSHRKVGDISVQRVMYTTAPAE